MERHNSRSLNIPPDHDHASCGTSAKTADNDLSDPGHRGLYDAPKRPLNVIIVGAGIAGLALAGLMGRSGHKVVVMEAAPNIADVGAGITCSPNLTRLLSRWGLDPSLRKHTNVLSQITLRRWEDGRFLGAAPLMPGAEAKHGAPQYVLHRADLHRTLMEEAETVCEIHTNSMVTSLDFHKASATLSDGNVFEADLIVGADGMKSTCRRLIYQRLGLLDKAIPTGDAAFRVCIPLDRVMDAELRGFVTAPVATRWMGDSRHVQAYPIRHGNLYNMVMCHPDTGFAEESWTAKASKQKILDHFGSWDPLRLGKLLELIPDDNIMEWRLCQHDPLPTWVIGKVVLIGDACHPMLPYVAQGAAQAIEDVAVLHLAVNRASNPEDLSVLLKAYQLARKPRSEYVMGVGGVTGAVLHLPDGPEQQVRDEKFRLVPEGGDNPDLLGDAEMQKFLWDYDPEKEFLENIESHITSWISSLHPKKLECKLDCNFLNGSYNLCQKLRFCDGTTWLLRMPIIGSVCDEYADEKIAVEVEVLSLLRDSNVPVPGIIAWGLTAANPLGLGPYIVMDFIEGVSVNTLLRQQHNTRLLRDDICDDDVKFLYRQFARILLQLFQIDFPVLGSLPTPVTGFNAPVRPLTFKAHDILQTGGVDTFGDRTIGFSDTADYFCYLACQDWAQFQRQPNSGGGPTVTQAKYAALRALQAIAPQLVEPSYASGPYKLVCDDLGLASLIVRSADDLTVVGVVDLEWSYAGPAQLFGSAPWWLLQDRLNNYDTFLDKEEAPRVLGRYLRNLDVFKTVLEEEEARMPGQQTMELSRLVRHSEESGSMWLHMLLLWGFNHPDNLPFTQLQARLGQERWKELEEGHHGKEAREFTEWKLAELDKYDEMVERMECLQDDVENGKMTMEAFVAVLREPNGFGKA